MSVPKIIAQSPSIQAFGLASGDFKLPTLLHVRVQMTAGAPVLVFGRDLVTGEGGTTIDTTVVLTGAGLFDFTFNPCRGFANGTLNFSYKPNASGTDRFEVAIDKSTTNTNGTTGKLRLVTNSFASAAAATPPNGSEFSFSIVADLG